MTDISVNTAIRLRGVSGTARSLEHILTALRMQSEFTVHEAQPAQAPTRSKLRNAVDSVYWDWWGAAHATDSALHVSPSNTGAARRGTPHLLVVHDTMVLDLPDSFDRGYRAYAKVLFGASVRSATRIMTPSAYSASRIRSRWPRSPEISVVPWPTRPQRPSRKSLPDGALRVLMVGATEPHKRHELGIEAVRIARLTSGVDIRLDIVGPRGRGERRVQAAMRASDHASSWIERHVGVSERELGRRYKQSWALLMTSEAEGYGLPLAEANAWALPAVHVGLGSMSEVAHGAVAHGDPVSLANGLSRLLDPAVYGSESAHAANLAAGQDISYFAGRLGRLIRGMLS